MMSPSCCGGDVKRAARWHTFQVLTKRPERMRRFVEANRSNVWLGTSVCSNGDVWRVDMLRATQAAIRFLSIASMIGPIDAVDLCDVDWMIAGGESGRDARRLEIAWVRGLRDRCVALEIPFFFKQWAARSTSVASMPRSSTVAAGRSFPASSHRQGKEASS